MELADIIWTDPQRLGGEPCFRGTRVPVWMLADYLEAGKGLDAFLEQYPDVPAEYVRGYIRLAHESLLAKAG